MSLVYIDTNVFLDFYQSTTDRLIVFEEVLARASSVLLTQQTVEEFRRNRVARLTQLADAVERSAQQQIFTTAVVRALPGFDTWKKARDASKAAALEIAKELRSWTVEETGDVVLAAFNKLVAAATQVPTDPALIERARTRKLLGQPPTTPDKHTIGDEIIWEALVQGASDDVVVVSRDKSFLDNQALLVAEFALRTGKNLLLITGSLTDGLERVGKGSEKIKVAERSMPKINPDKPFRFDLKCLSCGGDLDETGYEGSGGDSAWWLYCTACGSEFFPPSK